MWAVCAWGNGAIACCQPVLVHCGHEWQTRETQWTMSIFLVCFFNIKLAGLSWSSYFSQLCSPGNVPRRHHPSLLPFPHNRATYLDNQYPRAVFLHLQVYHRRLPAQRLRLKAQTRKARSSAGHEHSHSAASPPAKSRKQLLS